MKKRIEVLDGLRGFALLGILVANMLYFQYGDVTFSAIQPAAWWDKAAFYFTKIVVEASFYPIFGFLFGYGIILFVRSLENRDLRARGPLWRRAIGLMLLGGIHIAFIWDGDILLSYGAGLLIVLLFIKRKVKTLLVWAAVLAVMMVPVFLMKTDVFLLTEMEQMKAVLAGGTYLEVVQQRTMLVEDIPFIFYVIALPIVLLFISVFSFFAIGAFVLLGMAAAKGDFFAQVEAKTKQLQRAALLIPVGLACKSLLYWDHFLGKLIYGAGTYMLAIGYIALFALIYTAKHNTKLAQVFTSLGRLSLSNYLAQSLIFTTIYYGYGFGLFGQLGVALGLLLAVAVYILQLYGSTLYMKRFSIGPVEWLLRKFVYLGHGRR